MHCWGLGTGQAAVSVVSAITDFPTHPTKDFKFPYNAQALNFFHYFQSSA